jgi:hypothetical protein
MVPASVTDSEPDEPPELPPLEPPLDPDVDVETTGELPPHPARVIVAITKTTTINDCFFIPIY